MFPVVSLFLLCTVRWSFCIGCHIPTHILCGLFTITPAGQPPTCVTSCMSCNMTVNISLLKKAVRNSWNIWRKQKRFFILPNKAIHVVLTALQILALQRFYCTFDAKLIGLQRFDTITLDLFWNKQQTCNYYLRFEEKPWTGKQVNSSETLYITSFQKLSSWLNKGPNFIGHYVCRRIYFLFNKLWYHLK